MFGLNRGTPLNIFHRFRDAADLPSFGKIAFKEKAKIQALLSAVRTVSVKQVLNKMSSPWKMKLN